MCPELNEVAVAVTAVAVAAIVAHRVRPIVLIVTIV